MSIQSNFYGQAQILEALRTRICLTPPDTSFPLQETTVSKEFSVSRTPVRQVLQTLAREHLVEIRPSVGAHVTILPPETRLPSFHVYRDITAIAANMAEGKIVDNRRLLDLVGILGIVTGTEELTPEQYVALTVKVQTALGALVVDPVIKDAMLASFWRIIRWRVTDVEADPDRQRETFRQSIEAVVEAARGGDAAHVLRTVAGLSDRLGRME